MSPDGDRNQGWNQNRNQNQGWNRCSESESVAGRWSMRCGDARCVQRRKERLRSLSQWFSDEARHHHCPLPPARFSWMGTLSLTSTLRSTATAKDGPALSPKRGRTIYSPGSSGPFGVCCRRGWSSPGGEGRGEGEPHHQRNRSGQGEGEPSAARGRKSPFGVSSQRRPHRRLTPIPIPNTHSSLDSDPRPVERLSGVP